MSNASQTSAIVLLHSRAEELLHMLPFFKHGFVKTGAAAALRKMCAAHEHIGNLWAECESFGQAHGTDPRTVFLSHYMYDLAQAAGSWGTSQAPAACTVGCIGPHFVRYLDWGAPEGIGAFTEVQERECWSHPYHAIGFPGFFGLVTAISPVACFALNQVPCKKIEWTGIPSTYWARLFFERTLRNMQRDPDKLLPATNRVLGIFNKEKCRPMSSMCLTFTSGRWCVRVNVHPGDEPEVYYGMTQQPAVQANRFQGESFEHINDTMDPDALQFSKDREERMRRCLKRMAAKKKPQEAIDTALRLRYPVLNGATANIVVANLKTQQVALRKFPEAA